MLNLNMKNPHQNHLKIQCQDDNIFEWIEEAIITKRGKLIYIYIYIYIYI